MLFSAVLHLCLASAPTAGACTSQPVQGLVAQEKCGQRSTVTVTASDGKPRKAFATIVCKR